VRIKVRLPDFEQPRKSGETLGIAGKYIEDYEVPFGITVGNNGSLDITDSHSWCTEPAAPTKQVE